MAHEAINLRPAMRRAEVDFEHDAANGLRGRIRPKAVLY
jgi:hypothetical protein